MDERERARARRKRRREMKSRRKSGPNWWRLIAVGIIVIGILCGIGYGVYTGVSYAYHIITGTYASDGTAAGDMQKTSAETVTVEQKALDKPVYILVVGKDDNNPAQGDSLFLMALNVEQNTMDIVGIPSNSKIESRDQKSLTMISDMYAQGGIELTKAVVEDIFHISVPYYVVVDKSAFIKTNDVLGDQQFYVEKNMEHVDAVTGEQDINLRRGYQTLSGENAFAYLRYSDPKRDTFSRVQRQERFLKSWVENEHNSFFITNAWHIWRLWNHYDTNISTWDAVKLIRSIGKMNKENIHFYILPGEKEEIDDMTYWNINPTEAQRLVGIMTGNLSSDEFTQFVTMSSNSGQPGSETESDHKQQETE